jgi:hypothetical protein
MIYLFNEVGLYLYSNTCYTKFGRAILGCVHFFLDVAVPQTINTRITSHDWIGYEEQDFWDTLSYYFRRQVPALSLFQLPNQARGRSFSLPSSRTDWKRTYSFQLRPVVKLPTLCPNCATFTSLRGPFFCPAASATWPNLTTTIVNHWYQEIQLGIVFL